MSYVTKKTGHGQTRAMGPEPNIIRLALTELEKAQDPQTMTEAMVNGKVMEIKGKMLQMGIPTSLSLTMTYPDYVKRLEVWGRADLEGPSQTTVTAPKPKSTPKPMVHPATQQTVDVLEEAIKRDLTSPTKSGKGYSKQMVKTEKEAAVIPDDVMSINSSTEGGDHGKGSGEP